MKKCSRCDKEFTPDLNPFFCNDCCSHGVSRKLAQAAADGLASLEKLMKDDPVSFATVVSAIAEDGRLAAVVSEVHRRVGLIKLAKEAAGGSLDSARKLVETLQKETGRQ